MFSLIFFHHKNEHQTILLYITKYLRKYFKKFTTVSTYGIHSVGFHVFKSKCELIIAIKINVWIKSSKIILIYIYIIIYYCNTIKKFDIQTLNILQTLYSVT